MTGGDSYADIVPQTFSATDQEIPLTIWNKGKNILAGVSVRIVDLDYNFATGDRLKELKDTPTEEVGILHPGEGRDLKTIIHPHQDSARQIFHGANAYQIYIYSRVHPRHLGFSP